MSRFELRFEKMVLSLSQPFTISRGTKSSVVNVLVTLKSEDFTGLGEAAPNTRYEENAEKVMQYLSLLPDFFFEDVDSPQECRSRLDELADGHRGEGFFVPQSALAALEMAWLDLWAKRQDKPLWKLWGHDTSTGPQTSLTIGIDDIGVMQEKVRSARAYPILKVKLGTNRDKEIIKAIRAVTQKPIRIDANEGWKSLDEAKHMIRFLHEQEIELIEQPMPADQNKDLKKLKTWSPLPLAADESFIGNEPLEEIADAFDILNIKLMKIGSMVKAREVMKRAHTLGLKVMVGCMIESSIANTAGAILSLNADYADLDGHLLIVNDPAEGLQLDRQKRVLVNSDPGLGVRLKNEIN